MTCKVFSISKEKDNYFLLQNRKKILTPNKNYLLVKKKDHAIELIKELNCWVKKSMYGKSFLGVQRSSFIIDIERKIIKICAKVRVEGHAQDVLTSVKALSA